MDHGDPRAEASARLDGILSRLNGMAAPRVVVAPTKPAVPPIPEFLRTKPVGDHADVERRLRRQTLLLSATPFIALGIAALGFLLR